MPSYAPDCRALGMLKKTNDWELVIFLPALPPFIREVHRGCGGKEVSTRKRKTKQNTEMYFNVSSIYILFQGRKHTYLYRLKKVATLKFSSHSII
jgi:hypothetical protein